MGEEVGLDGQAQWVVYTRIDRSSIFIDDDTAVRHRTFSSLLEAEGFLSEAEWKDGPPRKVRGWQGPIPVVSLQLGDHAVYSGPLLAERIKFPHKNPRSVGDRRFDRRFDQVWQDSAADQVQAVMEELEAEGKIPGSDDPNGPAILTQDHLNLVNERLQSDVLRELTCSLGPCWDPRRIQVDARRRLGHINSDQTKTLQNRIMDAATDLEWAFLNRHPRCTNVDVSHFWTSLEVHVHLASFCREQLWDRLSNEELLDDARLDVIRALGSFAHEIGIDVARSTFGNSGIASDVACTRGALSASTVILDSSTAERLLAVAATTEMPESTSHSGPSESRRGVDRPTTSGKTTSKRKPSPALVVHRRTILKRWQTAHGLESVGALARRLTVSGTALYAMTRDDRSRYAAQTLSRVLEQISCGRQTWNNLPPKSSKATR